MTREEAMEQYREANKEAREKWLAQEWEDYKAYFYSDWADEKLNEWQDSDEYVSFEAYVSDKGLEIDGERAMRYVVETSFRENSEMEKELVFVAGNSHGRVGDAGTLLAAGPGEPNRNVAFEFPSAKEAEYFARVLCQVAKHWKTEIEFEYRDVREMVEAQDE
jgi:hypothetical protein